MAQLVATAAPTAAAAAAATDARPRTAARYHQVPSRLLTAPSRSRPSWCATAPSCAVRLDYRPIVPRAHGWQSSIPAHPALDNPRASAARCMPTPHAASHACRARSSPSFARRPAPPSSPPCSAKLGENPLHPLPLPTYRHKRCTPHTVANASHASASPPWLTGQPPCVPPVHAVVSRPVRDGAS